MAKPFEHAGKQYSNADAWRTAKATVSPKPQMAEEPEEGADMGGEDGSAVAAEHGPAHEIHMQHEHEMGAHHVHSVHPDGHEHHSDHGSVEEAHEHAKNLAGAGMEHEGPEEDEEEY